MATVIEMRVNATFSLYVAESIARGENPIPESPKSCLVRNRTVTPQLLNDRKLRTARPGTRTPNPLIKSQLLCQLS